MFQINEFPWQSPLLLTGTVNVMFSYLTGPQVIRPWNVFLCFSPCYPLSAILLIKSRSGFFAQIWSGNSLLCIFDLVKAKFKTWTWLTVIPAHTSGGLHRIQSCTESYFNNHYIQYLWVFWWQSVGIVKRCLVLSRFVALKALVNRGHILHAILVTLRLHCCVEFIPSLKHLAKVGLL